MRGPCALGSWTPTFIVVTACQSAVRRPWVARSWPGCARQHPRLGAWRSRLGSQAERAPPPAHGSSPTSRRPRCSGPRPRSAPPMRSPRRSITCWRSPHSRRHSACRPSQSTPRADGRIVPGSLFPNDALTIESCSDFSLRLSNRHDPSESNLRKLELREGAGHDLLRGAAGAGPHRPTGRHRGLRRGVPRRVWHAARGGRHARAARALGARLYRRRQLLLTPRPGSRPYGSLPAPLGRS